MSLVIKPVITEKSLHQAAHGVYTFIVPMEANKLTVAQAVEDLFKVETSDVRMAIMKGKVKTYRQIKGRRSNRKKAYVQLVKGQKIEAFDLGQEDAEAQAQEDAAAKKAKKKTKKVEAK